MGKLTLPRMEIVKFGTEDVIATSNIGIYSLSCNDMPDSAWYIIMNQEGAKGFEDWYDFPSHNGLDPDTLTLINMGDGDWYNDQAPSGNNIADQNDPEHTKLVYIWYGSGYGIGNVYFNTQGMPWSYYLDNNIPLPTSTQ